MRRFVIAAILAITLYSTSTFAAPYIYGAGTQLCSVWTAHTDNTGKPVDDAGLQLEAWVQGFVTAISTHPNTPDLAETTRAEMYSFVEGYCRVAPTRDLMSAAQALVNWLANGRVAA